MINTPANSRRADLENAPYPKRIDEKKKQILMRGECQLCKTKVVDDIDMSNTFYEYSKARFLE
jgi:hypothetical protein